MPPLPGKFAVASDYLAATEGHPDLAGTAHPLIGAVVAVVMQRGMADQGLATGIHQHQIGVGLRLQIALARPEAKQARRVGAGEGHEA